MVVDRLGQGKMIKKALLSVVVWIADVKPMIDGMLLFRKNLMGCGRFIK